MTGARARRRLFAPEQAPRLAVQAWLGSRLVLLITLLVVARTHEWTLTETLTRWDAVHFISLSQHGYQTLTEAAFFPGLPLVMAAFGVIGVPPVLTGTLLSLVGSGLAAWALYRLAGTAVPGAVAVAAWSFAPMAIFGAVPYTEAIFCAAAFWAF